MSITEQINKEKRGTSREREMLCGNSLLELARELNGSKEGLNNKQNRSLTMFYDKKPNIRKKDIDKKCKDMCGMLSIVKPQVFRDLVVLSNQENGR
jgi:hypothetical protein